MEEFLIVLGLGLAAIAFIALGVAVVAIMQSAATRDTLRRMGRRLDRLERGASPRPPESPPEQEPIEPPPTIAERLRESAPVREQKRTEPVAPVPPPPQIPVPPRPAIPTQPDRDWWAAIEESVGKRWMTWVGAIALFLSAGFFVKYAIDRDWLSPTVRVLLGAAFGIVLVGLGIHFLRQRRMRALGQGLAGAGLAVLYVSLYAAFAFYQLIGQPLAFGLMVGVSAAGMALASIFDALPISFISVLGGLLTPVMVSTGHDRRDLLFTYLLILDLSVLTLGLFKKWRALDTLAFIGTAVLYGIWFVNYYDPAARTPALVWLGVFYSAFMVLPFVDHLRRRTPATLERFLMAVANASLTFIAAHSICLFRYWEPIYSKAGYLGHHPHLLGWYVLGMGALCVGLGVIFRLRVPKDRRSPFGFIGMAATFATISIGLHFELQGMTLAFLGEALLLLFLGFRFRYPPVRIYGALVLALAVGRLLIVHMPQYDGRYTFFWNKDFGTALCGALACGIFTVIHHVERRRGGETDRILKLSSGIAGGLLALAVVHVEVARWLVWEVAEEATRRLYSHSAGLAIWTLGAAVFLGVGLYVRNLATRVTVLLPAAVALILGVMLYSAHELERYLLFLNLRFGMVLGAILLLFGCGWALRAFRDRCSEAEQGLAKAYYGIAIFCLLAFLSAEVFLFCRGWVEWNAVEGQALAMEEKARRLSQMALTITWSLYALALLVVGFARRVRALRFSALALFGLAAAKLLVYDIAGLDGLYRIIVTVAAGILMIGASYLYHRIESGLDAKTSEKPS